MDELRLQAVAARVVAWHNRHPLARRITAAQVRHVGLVLLPFAAPGDAPALSVTPPASAPAVAHTPKPPPEPAHHTAMPSAADEDQALAELMGELAPETAPDETSLTATAPAPDADPTIDLPLDELASASVPAPVPAAASAEPAAHESQHSAADALLHDAPPPVHDAPPDVAGAAAHAPEPSAGPEPDGARKPWWRRGLRATTKPTGPTALFTEDLMPEMGVKALIALALKHGLTQLPPGDRWQWRSAVLDRSLQDQATESGLTGRADRVLLTAALDDGTRRHRLLIGAGLKPHIEGPRLWDRRRVGALAGVGLVCLSVTAWAVGRHAGLSGVLTHAPAASAPAASAASSAPVPASAAQAPSQVASQAQASASAASATEPSASSTTGSATSSAHTPVPAVELPASTSAPGPHDASASAPSDPAMAALTPASATPQSIAPNLRPQLARVAQAQSTQRFALVSAPIRSGAEAQALLRRLRAETARVHHPVAVETSIHQSAQGWRVSWWPFANQRQADNARAALADRQLEMDVVEF